MENVEVYMINSVSDSGVYKTAGNIYTVKKHIAERLVEEGSAKIVNYPSLNKHKTAIENIVVNLKQELKDIDTDTRLTDKAKRDDKEKVISKYRQEVERQEVEYREEIDRLLKQATEQASKIKLPVDYDKEAVRVKVGLIKTDVTMSPNFTTALEILQKELKVIDKNVATELLAQFLEIKIILDKLGENIEAATRNGYVRGIYEDLKKKSQDDKQASAMREIDILNSMKKYSNITWPFTLATRYL